MLSLPYYRDKTFIALAISLFLVCPLSYAETLQRDSSLKTQRRDASFIVRQPIRFLSFEELKSLSLNPKPQGELREKLNQFWQTPLISNEAYHKGIEPLRPKPLLLGETLRVASWNIEKSLNIAQMIQLMTSESAFKGMIDAQKIAPSSEEYRNIIRQRERLIESDILILQEMEIGMKRSGYINAAETIAKSLGMNYVYAPQYLEIDPVRLGTESIELEEGGADQEALDYYRVDPKRYKGVFGSAVLSRYPIIHAGIHLLKNQPYDWYWGEKKKSGFLEKARRFGTKTLFENEITREMKVGGRGYFRVDLAVPDLPGGILTVINVHLEIKCDPNGREAQMDEILEEIKDIKNPVIMMGDYNAAPTDISPTSIGRVVKRTAKNPTTWLGAAVSYVSPHGLAINTTRTVSNKTKNFNDPFARNISVVAPNPLKDMFMMIQNFQFDDGYTFDFRGDPLRSIGNKNGKLANSNQRGKKGFVTTFSVKRPWGLIGKYRLDWVFVKSQNRTPEDTHWPYRFSPHFGETLEEMNTGLLHPISDHHPNIVDLPFEEPRIQSPSA